MAALWSGQKSLDMSGSTTEHSETRFLFFSALNILHVPRGWTFKEDDDIRPEGEEGWEEEVVDRRVPWEITLKQKAHLSLPHRIPYGQDHPHTDQETKDLREREGQKLEGNKD